jgi:hypothetical protein
LGVQSWPTSVTGSFVMEGPAQTPN